MKFIELIILVITCINAISLNLLDDDTNCGYESCHPVDQNKINVHLVPHSHDDVGYTSTVDQYYYQKVQQILSTVVSALMENPDRRFIQVETAFLYMWWNKQNDQIRSTVRQLINEGRLEIVNGAWSMNDEADVHYQSIIDQYTLGLKFLEDNLGKCARPRVGWQIDPFGHSREQASLLSQFGMDGVFFARVDYRDKEKRQQEKTMDMLWTGSANLGNDSTIFASVLFNHYSWPPNLCFDIRCRNAPIINDTDSFEYNWETKVNEFTEFIQDQIQYYPTNNILVTMGQDFHWQAAHNNYLNIDLLIEGFKLFNPTINGMEINLIYSTPSCYTRAVLDFVEANNLILDVKTDDFFPYADSANNIWTGYYTSRPSSKRLERYANNLLQVTKQLTTFANKPYETNDELSQAMGVMQHHDAITGTETAEVERDFHKTLVKGMDKAVSDISSAFSSILGLSNDLNLKTCLLANVSICSESNKNEFTILVYNPLARNASHYIQIPVTTGIWAITGPTGNPVEYHATSPIRNFDYISAATGEYVLQSILLFRAENLPPLGYRVYHIRKSGFASEPDKNVGDVVDQMGFKDTYINFDMNTGILKSITIKDVTLKISQKMVYYNSSIGSSTAYVFRPEVNRSEPLELGAVINYVLINDGNQVREVKQVWKDWATQTIRVYKEEDYIEFDWLVGPIPVTDGQGKEVIARYTTEITDTDGVFYTDSNGREMIYRKKNYRPTYNYTDEEPQSGNYYPVTTKIMIKNETLEFAVITDRAEGGTSLSSGEVELMLSRAIPSSLEESEYNTPLVVRGTHYVTFGVSTEGNANRTMAAVERDIAQRKHLQPWIFYTSQDIPIKEHSFLNIELPANVHLLTLENWSTFSRNIVLIRLEHVLEKDEDPNLSQEVSVDLSNVFKIFTIISMKEYMLGANTPLDESTKLKWPQVHETENDSSPLNKNNRLNRDETDLSITLAPMQIRTFLATVMWNN